jgi:hypothetical protein
MLDIFNCEYDDIRHEDEVSEDYYIYSEILEEEKENIKVYYPKCKKSTANDLMKCFNCHNEVSLSYLDTHIKNAKYCKKIFNIIKEKLKKRLINRKKYNRKNKNKINKQNEYLLKDNCFICHEEFKKETSSISSIYKSLNRHMDIDSLESLINRFKDSYVIPACKHVLHTYCYMDHITATKKLINPCPICRQKSDNCMENNSIVKVTSKIACLYREKGLVYKD